jgi:hypothetical protein
MYQPKDMRRGLELPLRTGAGVDTTGKVDIKLGVMATLGMPGQIKLSA